MVDSGTNEGVETTKRGEAGDIIADTKNADAAHMNDFITNESKVRIIVFGSVSNEMEFSEFSRDFSRGRARAAAPSGIAFLRDSAKLLT
jgi:hypothetical protein